MIKKALTNEQNSFKVLYTCADRWSLVILTPGRKLAGSTNWLHVFEYH